MGQLQLSVAIGASAAQETMSKETGGAQCTKPRMIIIVGPTATKWECNTLALPALSVGKGTTHQPQRPSLSFFDWGGRLGQLTMLTTL
jgi:hypothetical protein